MGVIDTQDVARCLLLVGTGQCYMLNIYGFRKEHFLSFSHNKSMGAFNQHGVTSFDPRGLIGRIYVGHHLISLHACTIYQSCRPHSFREVLPILT